MGTEPVKPGEFRLEVVVIPVSDVDRAKRFYESNGYRLSGTVTDFFGMPLHEFVKEMTRTG